MAQCLNNNNSDSVLQFDVRDIYCFAGVHRTVASHLMTGQRPGVVNSQCALRTAPSHISIPQIKMARKDGAGEYSLLNDVTRWRLCSVVPRACENRIGLWPLGRDDNSGVLIGTGGTRRSDWPVRVWANDVSTRIDRLHTRARTSVQLSATVSCCSQVGTHIG